MSNVIDLQAYRKSSACPAVICDEGIHSAGAEKIGNLADHVETLLEKAAQNDRFAHTVALAAGRYAAMHLFQLHGRAQTLSFFEDCIQNIELCDDLLKQMDEEY